MLSRGHGGLPVRLHEPRCKTEHYSTESFHNHVLWHETTIFKIPVVAHMKFRVLSQPLRGHDKGQRPRRKRTPFAPRQVDAAAFKSLPDVIKMLFRTSFALFAVYLFSSTALFAQTHLPRHSRYPNSPSPALPLLPFMPPKAGLADILNISALK